MKLKTKKDRKFVCITCKMTITFPPEHDMDQKLAGSYTVQKKWFCSDTCFNECYFPPSSERR